MMEREPRSLADVMTEKAERQEALEELVVMMARFLASYHEHAGSGVPDIKRLRELADKVEQR